MNASKSLLLLVAGLGVAAVALLGWQRHTADRLRGEIVRQQQVAGEERARLEDEHRRLMATQTSTGELQRLRAERTAVSSLLGEIEAMRHRADEAARATIARDRPLAMESGMEHSMREGPVPARFWKNAGQATPEAAFETALWAGAGGNVESLAGVLALDADARAKAEAVFAKLPAAMKQELATPERLIALLVAKDVPLGSAEILTQATPADATADTRLAAKLVDSEGKSKEVHLSVRSQDGNWRFVVPPSAVERYATLLQTPVAVR